MIKKLLGKIYYTYFYSSALGYRIRNSFLKKEEIAELKPFSRKAVISDLFIWRANKEWNTVFQLFNISSFLYPEDQPEEICEIHIFDSLGKPLKEITIPLKPYELKSIDFSLLEGLEGIRAGTFAVFHFSNILTKISDKGSRLTERGYISYLHNGALLHNYCHGNLQAVSKKYKGPIKSVVGTAAYELGYFPQLIFSDCSKFELLYTNPSRKMQTIRIILCDKKNKRIEEITADIQPLGMQLIILDNPGYNIHTIQSYGHIIMWRPLVKKFYGSYFDVLHG